jgi:hypothetical protein
MDSKPYRSGSGVALIAHGLEPVTYSMGSRLPGHFSCFTQLPNASQMVDRARIFGLDAFLCPHQNSLNLMLAGHRYYWRA